MRVEIVEENQQGTVSNMPGAAGQPAGLGSAMPTPQPGMQHGKRKMAVIAGVCALLVLSAGAYFVFGSGQKTAKRNYIVALMMPFTKDTSIWGASGLKGVELAKTQLGADNIQIIKEDTQCDKSLTPAAVDRLAAKNVIAIIGETCSDASLAALDQANKHKIVMISASASSPNLAIPNDYFFRVIPPDQYQGKFAANNIYNKGTRKVAILNSTDSYGTGLGDSFEKDFTALGGTIVAKTTFEMDDITFPDQLAKIKASNPEVIYLASNSGTSSRALLPQIKAMGITASIFGSDALYDRTLIGDAQDAAEGLTITTFSTGSAAFNKALQQDYAIGDSPGAYDAFKAIYLAIQKGAKTSEEVKTMLPSIEFDGVSGHIKFDKNGDVTDNYTYTTLQVKDRKFVVVK